MSGPDAGWDPQQGWGNDPGNTPAPGVGHPGVPAPPGYGAGPQAPAPGYGHFPGAPQHPLQGAQWGPFTPPRPRRSRRKLVIGAIAGVAVLAVAGGVAYVAWPSNSNSTGPSGPAEAAVPTTALSPSTVRLVPGSVLPTDQQVQQATLLGLSKHGDIDTRVYPDSKVDPASCSIAGSPDNVSVMGQAVSMAGLVYADKPGDDYRYSAYVSAAVFDTDAGAAAGWSKVADALKACTTAYTFPDASKPGDPPPRPWTISEVKTQDKQVAWLNTQQPDATHATPWKCGRAVRAAANLLVTAVLCSQNPSAGPSKLIDAVITNVNAK